MKTLAVLPISTKNMLEESRVLTFIQRWAQTKSLPQPTEMDGYSSENTSRAQTPLNTPDGSSTKLGPELEGDPSKPAVYRRLKIISENSLDSALSDASKASDGKEEEEEDDEEEEDEASHAGLSECKELKADPVGEAETPTKETMDETVKEIKEENQEETGMDLCSQDQPQSEDAKDKMDLVKEDEMKEYTNEEHEPEESKARDEQDSGKEQNSQEEAKNAELPSSQPIIEILEPKSQSIETDSSVLQSEPPSEQTDGQSEMQETNKDHPGNEVQPHESTTDAPPSSETLELSIRSEMSAVHVDPSVTGTPSQDEEEGVSDVESERSQEPQLSSLDISGMAARLLESWKDLKVSSYRNFKGSSCAAM